MITDTSGPRPSDRFIPRYIAGFFIFLTVLFSYFIYLSEKTYTGLVTDHAYEKGLSYNSVIRSSDAQDALGLRPVIGQQGRKITFSLGDRDGKPVHISKAKVFLFRPVQDGMDMTVDMTPAGTAFSADLAPPQPGLWEIRISAETAAGPYFTAKRMTFE